MSGVRANASRPAVRAACNVAESVAPLLTATAAASADSRTTVRMVPSIGFNTASYAAADARFNASAIREALTLPSVDSLIVLTSPRKIWLRMTPLFPRAPMSEPWLIA
ncbi:unannotated protein [freshwater metagenome]|uniref:Unannotated protein n=1 Tax=freshwater metagenome TaxID=449393 RepID=A0A6J6NBW2_9ZZZZ